MKILLADDERKVRLGLADMIEELYPQQFQYFEATDGESASAIAQTEQPDIAFIDIKMPRMDGLACLHQLRQVSPKTISIILSGFAEFNYAHEALKYGAVGYLLKPTSSTELNAILNKARQAIHDRWKRENQQFNDYISLALYKNKKKEEVDFFQNSGSYSFDFYIITAYDEQTLELCYQQLKNALSSCELYNAYFAITAIDGSLFLVTGASSENKETYRFLIKKLVSNQNQLTSICCTYSTLARGLNRALNLKKFRLVGICAPLNDCVKLQIITKCSWFRAAVILAQSLDNLMGAYQREEELYFQHIVKELQKKSDIKKNYDLLDKSSISSYLYHSIGVKIIATTFEELLISLEECARNIHIPGIIYQEEMVVKIMRYIEVNYMKDIAINTIAQMYNITPNYLSKIFHEKSGKRFVDYLTEVRITNAKRLLITNPGLSVQEVAQKVGYYSGRYFSKIFSRETGVLPSQFRKL
ncbi:response regulator [Ohessyouella blattaphilus]|uniref:Stage 0 sporulation protein A homolog n=1 Tax=Ohessyouella blattaphilus TaxID=2949333 RepID=A0ABT1EL54_9FIRM|nr:response regulator [Ohessyouella blattaphilus]MCP1111438.1 response regulator [Ohessyouella blattaphilus]MCR8564832.1 response regulator [Ohessyouella blattaphilus]